MIKVKTPTAIPNVLKNKGATLTEENCVLYLADANSYDSGKKKFIFPHEIYGCIEVKDSLKNAQNGKCCYCESKYTKGAVEHFRPKGNSIQGRGQSKNYPGYYWLVYDLSNILFICGDCNTNKGTYFPLKNPNQRARNHSQPISAEIPLLIHPALDDPLEHITFHKEAVIGLTDEGKATIEYMKLDRQDLFESRFEVYTLLNTFIYTAKKLYTQENNVELYKEALQYIKEYISPSAKYSAMTSIYFSQFSNEPEFATI
jgi:uncharacterized protein (TIGR02646 family)